MTLILTNVIQDMILNNIREVLVGRTFWIMLNAGGTVTCKPYNSKSTL